MAQSVIELLEVVNVNHQQAEFLAAALGAFEFQVQLLLEIASGAQTGQVIGEGKTHQVFAGGFADQQVLCDERQQPQDLCVFLRKSVWRSGEKLQRTAHTVIHKQRKSQDRCGACQFQQGVHRRVLAAWHEQRPPVLGCPQIQQVSVAELRV